MGNFNVKTTGRAAVPRSKRLREAGGYSSSGTVINAGNTSPSSGIGDGHTHANKAALDAIRMDEEFYLWVSQKTEGAEDSAEEKVKAGRADMALDSEKWAGRLFSSYLDQSVRRSDDVAFCEVQTPEVYSADFSHGILGTGFRLYSHPRNGSSLEVDDLTVRREMRISNLVIDQISTRSGIEILSVANMTITRVEIIPNSEETDYYAPGSTEIFYRCYYDNRNFIAAFDVDDIAMCKRFSAAFSTTKYYKRLVLGVGDGYIDLTSVSLDVDGTGVPEAGDVLIQYGNSGHDDERGYVIERNVIGTVYERMLRGLDGAKADGEEFFYAGLWEGSGGRKKPRVFIGDESGGYLHFLGDELAVKGEITVVNTDTGSTANLGYLPELFNNSSSITTITGGVVLSTIIGVRDQSNNLIAALNASTLGQDASQGGHGKLLIFAGSANAQSAGSATTRIYADGHIVSNSADIAGRITTSELNANGSTIGSFKISSGALTSTDTETWAYEGRTVTMYLSNSLISFLDKNSDNSYFVQALIGTGEYAPTSEISAIKVSITRSGQYSPVFNTGLNIDVNGNNATNIAIRTVSGMFQGLRPYVSVHNTAYTITDYDSVIYCDNTSGITLTLPSDPKEGQAYTIIHLSQNNLRVRGYDSGSGKKIRTVQSSWQGDKEYVEYQDRVVMFFWYVKSVGFWFYTWINH